MFEIIITEIKEVAVKTREYQKISEEGQKVEYGYVYGDWKENKTRTILRQETDSLDIIAVIKAINQIK